MNKCGPFEVDQNIGAKLDANALDHLLSDIMRQPESRVQTREHDHAADDMSNFVRHEEWLGRQQQKLNSAIDTASDNLGAVFRDRVAGTIDPDFSIEWQKEKSNARTLQEALIKGNPDAILDLMKGANRFEMMAACNLVNENFQRMGLSMSISVDRQGRVVFMDERDGHGVAITRDGRVGLVERGEHGEVIETKCFDPFAAKKMADRLVQDINLYGEISKIRPCF